MFKNNNSNLFIVAIIACVAIVTLFWMVQYSQQSSDVSEEQVLIVNEEGNIVGYGIKSFFGKIRDGISNIKIRPTVEISDGGKVTGGGVTISGSLGKPSSGDFHNQDGDCPCEGLKDCNC